MMGLVGLADIIGGKAKDSTDIIMPFVCIALAAVHFLLLRSCRKTKALVHDFRLYCSALAQIPDHSVTEMASILGVPADTAAKKLQEMCRRGYFNGYMDHKKQRMIFNGAFSETQLNVVYCPGCGARNAVSSAGGNCRYCDAPLSRQTLQR